MFTLIPRQLLRFIVLLVAQIILNRTGIDVLMGIYPMVYILFILMLPFQTPNWLLLMLGFVSGISVDLFSDTFGVHASAMVFMSFMRPFVLNFLEPREGYENGTLPWLLYYKINWFLQYAITLTFVHHLWFFFLEAFGTEYLYLVIGRVILNTIYTTAIIILSQYLFFQNK